MSFQTALFLPADLNTLITVFEKKVPLCFFKERHSSKRCQGVLFLPSATRCNVEISTKSGWKCHLYWDWGKRQIMQTARWEEGFCPPGLLVFGGKYPHVLFMGNENSLKVNYGGLGKRKTKNWNHLFRVLGSPEQVPSRPHDSRSQVFRKTFYFHAQRNKKRKVVFCR